METLTVTTLIWLAILGATTGWIAVVAYTIATVFLLLWIYLFYSVFTYFGIDRAYGLDHFMPDASEWPMVKKGIFQYTNNGMYYFGFLVLWIPGLLLFSQAALLAALFNHLYIWVHYFCTEQPDMDYIYDSS